MANLPANKQTRPFILTIALAIILFVLLQSMLVKQERVQSKGFSEFMEAVNLPPESDDRIVAVTFRGQVMLGTTKNQAQIKTIGPATDLNLRKELETKGVKVNYEAPEEQSWWKALLIQSLPIIFFVALFFFLMRQLQSGGGKAMSFGKSRAKMITDYNPKVTFADIAGIDEAKGELQEVVEFLKDPKKFTKLGGRIPKGVLLVGSPGTGMVCTGKRPRGWNTAVWCSLPNPYSLAPRDESQ